MCGADARSIAIDDVVDTSKDESRRRIPRGYMQMAGRVGAAGEFSEGFLGLRQFPCFQNCETRNFFAQNMPETID